MRQLKLCLCPHPGLSWQQGRHLSPQMSGIYSAQTTFHIDGLPLLWSASHSLGRNPLRAVIPFDLIWFVAHRGKWWERLLSWPSRNKLYQIRHIGLSVLAHTMGINWSPNTTDKSIPSFPPWALQPIARPCHLINRASLANRRRVWGWLTAAQRWARKEVGERESIRKPLAAGAKVRVVWCSQSTQQSTEEQAQRWSRSVLITLLCCRDLVLICKCKSKVWQQSIQMRV